MRNANLTILAALSLAMLAVLAFGYIGSVGLAVEYIRVTPSGNALRDVGADVSGGLFNIGWADWPTNSGPTAVPGGRHVFPRYRLKMPLVDNWLWGFQIDRYDRYGGVANISGTVLKCPLWFAALPCTIAPIARLRRRRRRAARGFPVEATPQGEMDADRQTPTRL